MTRVTNVPCPPVYITKKIALLLKAVRTGVKILKNSSIDMKNLIYLELAPYLEQWFRHRHGAGPRGTAVSMTRGCVEWRRLRLLIDVPPADYVPSRAPDGWTPVEIPYYSGKDPRTYWYISDKGRRAVEETLLDLFDTELYDFYLRGYIKGLRISYMVIAWMEQKGIEYTEINENAVKKRLDRIRNVVACARRRRSKKQGKSLRAQGLSGGSDISDNSDISETYDCNLIEDINV